MTTILLLTALSQVMAPPPPGTVTPPVMECPQLYISLDESRQARMVHVWADGPLESRYADTPAERRKLDRLNAIRERIDVIACDWDDFDRREKHRIPQFPEPRYRFGRYGEWVAWPQRCWVHPEFSLRWLDYERQRWGMTDRIAAWKRHCDRLQDASRTAYLDRHGVYTWGWRGGRYRPLPTDGCPIIPVVAYPPSPADLLRDPLDWGN